MHPAFKKIETMKANNFQIVLCNMPGLFDVVCIFFEGHTLLAHRATTTEFTGGHVFFFFGQLGSFFGVFIGKWKKKKTPGRDNSEPSASRLLQRDGEVSPPAFLEGA